MISIKSKLTKAMISSFALVSLFSVENAYALSKEQLTKEFFPLGVYFVKGQKPISDKGEVTLENDFRVNKEKAKTLYGDEFQDLSQKGFNTAVLSIDPLVHNSLYRYVLKDQNGKDVEKFYTGAEKHELIKDYVDTVLNAAKENSMYVIPPMGDLERKLYEKRLENPKRIFSDDEIRNLLDKGHFMSLKNHSNVIGYEIADEPNTYSPYFNPENLAKIKNIIDEEDSNALSLTTWNNNKTVKTLYDGMNPDVVVVDMYPFATRLHSGDINETPKGDLTNAMPRGRIGSTDFEKGADQSSYTNWMMDVQNISKNTPVWAVLQAFGGDRYFREIEDKELRLQAFMALKNGAKGLFYFLYQTEVSQSVIKLYDNKTGRKFTLAEIKKQHGFDKNSIGDDLFPNLTDEEIRNNKENIEKLFIEELGIIKTDKVDVVADDGIPMRVYLPKELHGLKDENGNATSLMNEAVKINEKVNILAPTLLKLSLTQEDERITNNAVIEGVELNTEYKTTPEVQTFIHEDGTKYFMVVNSNLDNKQDLKVGIKKSWLGSQKILKGISTYKKESFAIDNSSEYIYLTIPVEAADGRLIKLEDEKVLIETNEINYLANSNVNDVTLFNKNISISELLDETEAFKKFTLKVNVNDNGSLTQKYKVGIRFGKKEGLWEETRFYESGDYVNISEETGLIELDLSNIVNDQLSKGYTHVTRLIIRSLNNESYVPYSASYKVVYETGKIVENELFKSKDINLYTGNTVYANNLFSQLPKLDSLIEEGKEFINFKYSVLINDNDSTTQKYKIGVRFGNNKEGWSETKFYESSDYKAVGNGWAKLELDFTDSVNEELKNGNNYITRLIIRAYNSNENDYVEYQVKDKTLTYSIVK